MIKYGDLAAAAVGALGTYYAGDYLTGQLKEMTGAQAGLINTHYANAMLGEGGSIFGMARVPGMGFGTEADPRISSIAPIIGGMGADTAGMAVLGAGGILGAAGGALAFRHVRGLGKNKDPFRVRTKSNQAARDRLNKFRNIRGEKPIGSTTFRGTGAWASNKAYNFFASKGATIGFGSVAGLAAGVTVAARFVDRLSQNIMGAGSVGTPGRYSPTSPVRSHRRARATSSRVARQAGVTGDLVLNLAKTGGLGAVRR